MRGEKREGRGERGEKTPATEWRATRKRKGPRFWGPCLGLVMFAVIEKEEVGKRRNK
jgi:hypothetical protein